MRRNQDKFAIQTVDDIIVNDEAASRRVDEDKLRRQKKFSQNKMLTILTNHQKELNHKISLEWSEKIFSYKTSLNKAKATEFIELLYSPSQYKIPQIIFADSPLACQIAANKLAVNNTLQEYKNWYWIKAFNSYGNQIFKKYSLELFNETWFASQSEFRSKMMYIFDTYPQIVRRVKKENMKFYEFNYYASYFIWSVPIYDFFYRIGILNNYEFAKFKDLITATGIYDMLLFKKYCIVCSMPVNIKSDEQNRLHSDDHYAIEWKDGFGLYFLHGICVPEKLIKAPGSITKKEIINEKNVEMRRHFMERMGSERFSEVLGLEEIDSDTDHQGNEQVLYRTKEKDDMTKRYLYFARVICPSTGRKYYLSVPRMRNVWDAVGYTFNKNKESYKPMVET